MTEEKETTKQTEQTDNADVDIEYDKDYKDQKVPPTPVPFYEWGGESDPPRYKGDKNALNARIQHKIYNMWLIWLNLRINPKIDELLQKITDDKESDEYHLKSMLVTIIDILAKCLSDTDIMEEIVYLNDDKPVIINKDKEEKK